MAMNFQLANRAENPDMAKALMMQTQLANELKAIEAQTEAQAKTDYLTAGTSLAEAAPEGTFSALGDLFGGGAGAGAGATALTDAALGSTGMGTLAAEIGAGAGAGAMGAGAGMGSSALLGAEAGTAALATEAGAGLTGMLGSIGPVGWAALGAMALGLFG